MSGFSDSDFTLAEKFEVETFSPWKLIYIY